MIKKTIIAKILIIIVLILIIFLSITKVLADSLPGTVTIQTNDIIETRVGSGGSSGGGGSYCLTNWTCDSWSSCVNDIQTRNCTKINKMCFSKEIPETQRKCNLEKSNETSSRKVLFDINLKILTKQIEKDNSLKTSINLINFGIPGKVNVSLHYTIIDTNGKTVYEKEEIVPVETQNEFIKNIDTSKLEEGNYTLIIDLRYEGQKENARTQESFTVIKNKEKNNKIRPLLISIIILIISVIIVLTALFIKLKKKSKFTVSPNVINHS